MRSSKLASAWRPWLELCDEATIPPKRSTVRMTLSVAVWTRAFGTRRTRSALRCCLRARAGATPAEARPALDVVAGALSWVVAPAGGGAAASAAAFGADWRASGATAVAPDDSPAPPSVSSGMACGLAAKFVMVSDAAC